MKSIIYFFVALSISTWLSGCATQYRKYGITGGYTETKMGKEIYSVRFLSNGYTLANKTGDFCMLRCAELARNDGYDYFKVMRAEERIVKDFGSEKQRNHNIIKLYKTEPAGDEVYEAKAVIESVKDKYKIKNLKMN